MEDNTVRTNEIEEVEDEVEEVSESSNGSAFVAGIFGGFLAYAAISGAKKLRAFIVAKMADRRQKETKDDVIEAEFTEVSEEETDSEEEPPKQK